MTLSESANRPRANASGSEASSCSASSMSIVIASEAKQSRKSQRKAGLPRRCAPRNDDLKLGKGHALLAHIFAGTVGVADFARLVALEEQELARAFVGVDLGRERRGVGEFESHMPFPAGLKR